jgi:polysaccharide biosynthesis/export protein
MSTLTLVSRTLFVMMLTAGIGGAGNVLGAETEAPHKSRAERARQRHAAEKPKAAAASIPRELAMRPLPAYRIGPPDVLQIEVTEAKAASMVGCSRTESGGGLVIGNFAIGSGSPTKVGSGTLTVTGAGGLGTLTVTGPGARPSAASGMLTGGTTVTSAKSSSDNAANRSVKCPYSLQIEQCGSSPARPLVVGQHLVAPDGTVNLREYGMVQVMGKTVEEAQAAVQKQVSKSLTSPAASVKVSLAVLAYNSKAYYIITQGAGLGDNVRRIPITGNETVLDALAAINGLSQVSSTRMWIARPSPSDPANGTILPVDYEAITQRGATATNYQIIPGDRLFIVEDSTTALNTWVAKKTTSIERVLGLISLGAATVESIEKLLPQEHKEEKGSTP